MGAAPVPTARPSPPGRLGEGCPPCPCRPAPPHRAPTEHPSHPHTQVLDNGVRGSWLPPPAAVPSGVSVAHGATFLPWALGPASPCVPLAQRCSDPRAPVGWSPLCWPLAERAQTLLEATNRAHHEGAALWGSHTGTCLCFNQTRRRPVAVPPSFCPQTQGTTVPGKERGLHTPHCSFLCHKPGGTS